MAANERCKKAEDTIKSQTGNVERYSKLVEEKFNEVRIYVYVVYVRTLYSYEYYSESKVYTKQNIFCCN